jgi:lysyl-tRNA synthetase class 2
LLTSLRHFLDSLGLIEVQTPILSQSCILDRHLDPIAVPDHGSRGSRFLQTSPEQNMKRLLASGLDRIYQVGPVFRAGEQGRLHNPEFTMAEWYRVGDGLSEGVMLLESLMAHLLQRPPAVRLHYAEAMMRWARVDPMDDSLASLQRRAIQQGLVSSPDWSQDRDDWLDLLFSHLVQPHLGHDAPVTITHFPASQAALAKIADQDPRTAERFEYFDRGLELANGYHDLLDAEVLRERNRKANRARVQDGRHPLPEDSLVLEAMRAGLPPCAGCALGFDRVVMLACGADHIDQVLCFPWDRA